MNTKVENNAVSFLSLVKNFPFNIYLMKLMICINEADYNLISAASAIYQNPSNCFPRGYKNLF